jgi:hypothetical protein
MFFGAVGVLAWIWALAVLWIFAESGGALTVIAAGIYAVVAMVALGCERVLKTLEDIRDGRVETPRASVPRTGLMARSVRPQSRELDRVEPGTVHTATS